MGIQRMECHLGILTLGKHLLSTCCVLSTVLGSKDRAANLTVPVHAFAELEQLKGIPSAMK